VKVIDDQSRFVLYVDSNQTSSGIAPAIVQQAYDQDAANQATKSSPQRAALGLVAK